jgi:hypothetical protein
MNLTNAESEVQMWLQTVWVMSFQQQQVVQREYYWGYAAADWQV